MQYNHMDSTFLEAACLPASDTTVSYGCSNSYVHSICAFVPCSLNMLCYVGRVGWPGRPLCQLLQTRCQVCQVALCAEDHVPHTFVPGNARERQCSCTLRYHLPAGAVCSVLYMSVSFTASDVLCNTRNLQIFMENLLLLVFKIVHTCLCNVHNCVAAYCTKQSLVSIYLTRQCVDITQVRWKMCTPHISLSSLLFLCQKFSRWKFDEVLTKIVLHSFLRLGVDYLDICGTCRLPLFCCHLFDLLLLLHPPAIAAARGIAISLSTMYTMY